MNAIKKQKKKFLLIKCTFLSEMYTALVIVTIFSTRNKSIFHEHEIFQLDGFSNNSKWLSNFIAFLKFTNYRIPISDVTGEKMEKKDGQI